MALGNETVRFSYSPDGTVNIVQSISPPAGELWYVENVHVYSDNAGSDAGVTYEIGVWESGLTPGPNVLGNGVAGVVASFDASIENSASHAIGLYLDSNETLHFGDTEGTADATTIIVVVTIRRIL